MRIMLQKFGTTLTSRQMGKEAYAAFQPYLRDLEDDEQLEVDFAGVNTFSPSWGDEFLTPLADEYGGRLVLKNTENLSVRATLRLFERLGQGKYQVLS